MPSDPKIQIALTLDQLRLIRNCLWLKYQGLIDEDVKREVAVIDTYLLRIVECHD